VDIPLREQPRPEHPRPQWVRERWRSLNGRWQFETDVDDSGLERGLVDRELDGSILVPFAPESSASGVCETDFLEAVWYRRTVRVPAGWSGTRLWLHFGAVDHDATVWVDGVEVVRHRGGFTPFSADITDAVGGRDQLVVVVRARDPRHAPQARGKQSTAEANSGCFYTRTTGIWQTVWLEALPAVHLKRPRITPDVSGGAFHLELPLSANRRGWRIAVTLMEGFDTEGLRPTGRALAKTAVRADLDLSPRLTVVLPPDQRRTWSPSDPHLYGLRVELLDEHGDPVDSAYSYTGLRSLALDGTAVRLNGRNVFQRLVLDQGYWPQSLMTAPDDRALVTDIELGQAAGFNGARLHQKVFEERYLFHADRLGYLVWGEFGDWGTAGSGVAGEEQQPTASFVAQWLEALERDYNHPAIVGWCPLNETKQPLHDRITVLDDVTRAMFLATKAYDLTRPVIDASGYSHRVPETDIYDSHSYEQDPTAFAAQQAGLGEGRPFANTGADGSRWSQPYTGQPYFVSELGGIWWNAETAADDERSAGHDREHSWGYGHHVTSEEAWHQRFAGLVTVLLDDARMFGYCYTQLTDVFQEQNGIYRFDRTTKLDVDRIRAVQRRGAAFEEDGAQTD